jgi:hypothetical protein
MITYEIGLNAGKSWKQLNEQGEHSLKELRKKLKLSDHEFYMAIGWLAREGKIFHFEKDDVLMVCLTEE